MKNRSVSLIKLSCRAVILSLIFFSWAMADVTLNLPEGITLLAVNGSNTKTVEKANLPDGLNQIVMQYHGEYGFGGNDLELEYSDVFVVTFSAVNEVVKMLPTGIKNRYDYRMFNKNPNIQLVSKDGKQVKSVVDKLEKPGLQIVRNYEQELVDFNRSDSPAAVDLSRLQQSAPPSQRTAPGKPAGNLSTAASSFESGTPSTLMPVKKQQKMIGKRAVSPEKMLKYWYQQADEETRERFKIWINRF